MVEKAKGTLYKYLGAAFMEQKEGGAKASLGRYFSVPVLGVILWKMTQPTNGVTMTDAALFGMLLGYNGWTKFQSARKG